LFASAVLLLTANLSFSQVFINEVSTNTDEIEVFGQTCDWIELYNPSPGYAYMHGFSISDDPNNPQKWQFPDNYKLEPYGFLMVLCNDEATGANTNFKLSAKGETIILSDKDGNIVDQVIVPPLLEDQTYGRVQDGSYIWGVFKEATPYASNNSSEAFTTPPTVDIEGGFYNENQSVTVTCTDPDAEILYSTNGCEPFSKASSNHTIFTINKNTVLRVCAINPELK
ncbi:MAG: lamin tail domain-containing protein, partial [Bacteroidales bacterium]|nr:lamin tail domain-containing protein [Bacteroidales bacterium]